MTKQVTERELVLAILMEVTQQNVYSHLALNAVLEKYQYLEKTERALSQECVKELRRTRYESIISSITSLR